MVGHSEYFFFFAHDLELFIRLIYNTINIETNQDKIDSLNKIVDKLLQTNEDLGKSSYTLTAKGVNNLDGMYKSIAFNFNPMNYNTLNIRATSAGNSTGTIGNGNSFGSVIFSCTLVKYSNKYYFSDNVSSVRGYSNQPYVIMNTIISNTNGLTLITDNADYPYILKMDEQNIGNIYPQIAHCFIGNYMVRAV